jgi:hypothetical protein
MCKLKKGPPRDAFGPVGAIATVFVTSSDEPMMRITNADFNGQPLVVDAEGRVELPPLPAGNNVLDLVVTPSPIGADVVLTEDCKDGATTRPLKKKFIGGGDDPHVGYTIHA